MWAQWYHPLFCRKTQKKEIGSGGSEENAHIVVFGGCPKMAPDENAYIIVNRAPQARTGGILV